MVTTLSVSLTLEIKAFQNFHHLFCWNISTQTLINLLWSEVYRHWLLFYWIYINDTLGNSACTHILKELGCSIKSSHGLCFIHTTLKSPGSLRTKATRTSSTTDAGTIKGSSFQYNSSSILCNLRLQATHYTSQTSWLFAVGNNQLLPLGNTRRIIQGMKVFPSYSPTGSKTFTSYLIIIVGMHRLTQLYHYKISYIYNIIDGTDSCIFQTNLHPLRRFHNLYIF